MKIGGFAKELYFLAIIFIVFYVTFNILMPFFLGVDNPIATVNGPSMEPTFHDGDLVILAGVRPEDIKVGDVIVYSASWAGGEDVIHRVVSIEERGGTYLFRVQGDNRETNPVPDPGYVTPDEIRGKVIVGGIPMAGRLLSIVQSLPGRVTVMALLASLLIKDYVDYKRKSESGGPRDAGEPTLLES